MLEIFVVPLICALTGNLGAWFLMRWRSAWSRRKTIVIAALPLPSIILALCLLVFFNAATASEESCGVDACGMAMMFSTFGMLYGLAGYGAGLVGAFGATAIARKYSREDGVAEDFE